MASVRDELSGIVLTYLAAAENRNLELAGASLRTDVEIVFPGGVQHEDLAAVVASARERYRSVSKTVDHVDVDTGNSTVIVTGRLSGENHHGVRFAGVRFIDRFRIIDGAIALQHVWNDLEESGVLVATVQNEISPQYQSA